MKEASVYYGELYVYRCAMKAIGQAQSEANRSFLSVLLRIFAYTRILESAVIMSDYLTQDTVI